MTQSWWVRGGIIVAVESLLWAGQVKAQEAAVEPAAPQETKMPVAVEDGATVKLHYKLTVDGQVVDSSEGREPLRYIHGQRQIVPGLERELTGMQPGESKHVTVPPKDGYGDVDPQAFIQVPKEQLPADVTLQVGLPLRGTSADGRPFRAMISEVGEDRVTLDLNHPLAGKTLEFDVEVAEVTPKQ